jgi:hypothetical protein
MPALRRRIALLTGFLAQARQQSLVVIRNRANKMSTQVTNEY